MTHLPGPPPEPPGRDAEQVPVPGQLPRTPARHKEAWVAVSGEWCRAWIRDWFRRDGTWCVWAQYDEPGNRWPAVGAFRYDPATIIPRE